MIILTADQATKKTGVCVMESISRKLLYSTTIEEKDKNYFNRIYNMRNRIFDTFEKYKCEVISFEGCTYQNNAQALIMLAQLQGMILSTCMDKELLYIIPKATEWRSICEFKGGRRDVQKQLAIQFVKDKYDLDLSDKDDEAEAICLAWAISEKHFKDR